MPRKQPLRSDAERNALAEANLNLVWWCIRKYTRSRLSEADEADLFQAGVLGLLRAAALFDESLGFTFATYATCAIRRSLHRHLSNQNRVCCFSDLPGGGARDGDGGGFRADAIADPKADLDPLEGLARRELIQTVLSSVSPREAQVLRLCWLEEKPVREASRLCGVSNSRIDQIIKKAVRRARKAMLPT